MDAKELLDVLSTAFKKEEGTNNYKLISVVTDEITELTDTFDDTKKAHFIDDASGNNLENLAQLFNVRRNADETDMHFRARIKVQYRKYIAHATHKEIKDICAAVLETTTARIEITDNYPATFSLEVFISDLENAELSEAEFKTIAEEIKPAGVRIVTFKMGTFECLEIGGSHDTAKAYNNLANANPDGGTYSGFL